MNLLLHVCCGPCAAYPLGILKDENINIQGLFYNPNIHQEDEYESRLNSAKVLFGMNSIPFEELGGYGLDIYMKKTAAAEDRCYECYYMRMDKIAEEAKNRGIENFTTTLLVSPYQKHDMLVEIANEAANRHGVNFYYRDFREGFREGQKKAREAGLYMQKYCGCFHSLNERNTKKS